MAHPPRPRSVLAEAQACGTTCTEGPCIWRDHVSSGTTYPVGLCTAGPCIWRGGTMYGTVYMKGLWAQRAELRLAWAFSPARAWHP